MGARPTMRCSRFALFVFAATCPLASGIEPAPSVPNTVARGVAPGVLTEPTASVVFPPLPPLGTPAPGSIGGVGRDPVKTSEGLIAPSDDPQPQVAASGSLRAIAGAAPKLRPPLLIRESDGPSLAQRTELPPITEAPGAPLVLPKPELAAPVVPVPEVVTTAARVAPPPVPPVSAGEFLPPIPSLPDAPLPTTPAPNVPLPTAPAPSAPPAPLPPMKVAPPVPAPEVIAGPIDLDGQPVTFDTLSKLVDGTACPSCGGGGAIGGCSTCGDCGGAQCRSGGKRCEPYPAHTAAGRVIGLIYSSICCPDPCYQPKWEPLADAAFFTDAVRPKTSTRFRWDYGNHYAYPDRGEYFFARADGNGKGPKANSLVKAIPYVDYHELNLITEIATGNAGVQIAVPYRAVNSTPFGPDGAGFADMSITAKTLLLDSELMLFGFQMRTYIPIGQPAKGLGTGHVSLEPGLNFGLRCSPDTYLEAQVVEWIPLGGDKDYQGANLRWGTSLNHVLWRPIRDVQLVGTLESTGISFQDGLFTDPALGPQRLAKRTSAAIGPGARLFFCDTFDMGVGWQHAITGKYLVRDQMRLEFRYRY